MDPVGAADRAGGRDYAIVVVDSPLSHRIGSVADMPQDDISQDDLVAPTFHYAIPKRLEEILRLGQLVWVPFGARYLQGVVVGFDDRAPVAEIKAMEAIIDLQPALSTAQIRLAFWISRYYFAPIYLVIRAMLPPGMIHEAEQRFVRENEVSPEESTVQQRELLETLRHRGPLDLQEIATALQEEPPEAKVLIDDLLERGWVNRQWTFHHTKTRPKTERVVRLHHEPSPEEYPSARAHKQREILDYLVAARGEGRHWFRPGTLLEAVDTSHSVLNALLEKGLLQSEERLVWRHPLDDEQFVPVEPPTLTSDQDAAWQPIARDLQDSQGMPFLLHGVTGSGKTEIYLRAVEEVLSQGRGAIVLVPEIALTPQTIRRVGARFPDEIAVMHSRLSDGERYDQWRQIRDGKLRLVIGPRSAIFAPVQKLGLIVLDEEHEWTYKQQQTPRYHTREVAIRLAKWSRATLILGSATPALESAYRAERGLYVRLELPQRIMAHREILARQAALTSGENRRYHQLTDQLEDALYADLPPVEVVDLRAELRAGNTGIFSRLLRKEMQETLSAHEQIILFLNRRGSATFVMCRDCGYVIKCPRCDVPLTYHASRQALLCHHCNYKAPIPKECPRCWSRRIKYFGIGTERVEEAVRALFPQARVVRWDSDTTGAKGAHGALLDSFIEGRADIMIGTQMIAKGLDLPRVTLVGVVTADTILNLPDFRAGERTFQLLTQVAGRAGRSHLGGRVIIQTYTPEHPAIQAASQHNYNAYYEHAMAFRREQWYPPLSSLVRLLYLHENPRRAEWEAHEMHALLERRIAALGLPQVDLLGAAPAFFARERGKWRWQILLRGDDPAAAIRGLQLPRGWRIDVDPTSTL